MKEVILHVYDVTNSDSEKTNSTILQINRIFKDRIGLGGIFHSAVQVYGEEEWSFGYCEHGSGVFSCPPGKNPMYTYRECIVLGETDCSILKVNQILRELGREWPGNSYDLLSKNCNHFCDAFCERLGVPKLPGWVNRFANAGDTAMVVAGNTAYRFRQAKAEVVTASKVAYRFMAGLASNSSPATPESQAMQTEAPPGSRALGSRTSFLPVPEPVPSHQVVHQIYRWRLTTTPYYCRDRNLQSIRQESNHSLFDDFVEASSTLLVGISDQNASAVDGSPEHRSNGVYNGCRDPTLDLTALWYGPSSDADAITKSSRKRNPCSRTLHRPRVEVSSNEDKER
uniref:PPPDE domain-containing protein n=1 Tax=Ananas comosus var. bracteatus TaxID=296719 RepID=A0A6V7PXB4_ANACO|nr:unnamed protein product [Ananas comosus var. bracteatus]